MSTEPSPPGPEARNAAILRRTLAAASWLYALWSTLLGVLAWGKVQGPYDGRLILGHSGLLAAAAVLLWKPRRGALAVTLLACIGSVYFAVIDYRLGGAGAALIDGAYPAIALFLLYNSRPHA